MNIGNVGKAMSGFGKNVNSMMAGSAPYITAAATGGVGLMALGEIGKEVRKAIDIHNMEQNLILKNPELANVDPQALKDYLDVVKLYSPQASRNPLVTGALISKMVNFGGVDHKLVQDIAKIESDKSGLGDQLSSLMGYKAPQSSDYSALKKENEELARDLRGSGRTIDELVGRA